jgi:hypothetical protein
MLALPPATTAQERTACDLCILLDHQLPRMTPDQPGIVSNLDSQLGRQGGFALVRTARAP